MLTCSAGSAPAEYDEDGSPARMPFAKDPPFLVRVAMTAVSSLHAFSCVNQSGRCRSLYGGTQVRCCQAGTQLG
jgi:hypothetical protein